MVKRDSALSDAELGAKLRAVGNVAVPYVLLEEMSKLESELAELRKDRERLNFAQEHFDAVRYLMFHGDKPRTLRQAIDEAMTADKEERKQ